MITAPTTGQYVTFHTESGDRLALVTGVAERTVPGGTLKGHDGDALGLAPDTTAYDVSLHVTGSTTPDVENVRQGNSAGEWEPMGA